jgi:hypothetical protein
MADQNQTKYFVCDSPEKVEFLPNKFLMKVCLSPAFTSLELAEKLASFLRENGYPGAVVDRA